LHHHMEQLICSKAGVSGHLIPAPLLAGFNRAFNFNVMCQTQWD